MVLAAVIGYHSVFYAVRIEVGIELSPRPSKKGGHGPDDAVAGMPSYWVVVDTVEMRFFRIVVSVYDAFVHDSFF